MIKIWELIILNYFVFFIGYLEELVVGDIDGGWFYFFFYFCKNVRYWFIDEYK